MEEVGWLVEYADNSDGHRWFGLDTQRGPHPTPIASEGLRFARERDAQAVIDIVPGLKVKCFASEHSWSK